jgi:hypothetical protein
MTRQVRGWVDFADQRTRLMRTDVASTPFYEPADKAACCCAVK